MNEPVNMAVIGCGRFGSLHARTLARLPEAKLVAIMDSDAAQAERLGQELNVQNGARSWDELIRSRAVNAVVIATPTPTHVDIALDAMRAGWHVLIEKPVSASLAGIEKLVAARSEYKRVVMAGHICFFHSRLAPLIKRVRACGFTSAHFVRNRPAITVERFPNETPLTVTLIHDLYLAQAMVSGERPADLLAWCGRRADDRTDRMWVMLRWKDGRVATFHSHWILPPGMPEDGYDWVEVIGPDYWTRVEGNPQPWEWVTEKHDWPIALEISEVSGRPTGMMAEELRSFVSACNGAPVPNGCRLEDARELQVWIEQLERAATPSR